MNAAHSDTVLEAGERKAREGSSPSARTTTYRSFRAWIGRHYAAVRIACATPILLSALAGSVAAAPELPIHDSIAAQVDAFADIDGDRHIPRPSVDRRPTFLTSVAIHCPFQIADFASTEVAKGRGAVEVNPLAGSGTARFAVVKGLTLGGVSYVDWRLRVRGNKKALWIFRGVTWLGYGYLVANNVATAGRL